MSNDDNDDNDDDDNVADNDDNSNVVFRKWEMPASPKQDPEVLTLEAEATITRNALKKMQEKGRQVRLHRLQALDALETKRVTLTEILRRLDNELFNDTDVYEYGDVLAEVFGERKIFAHRAIGLEALLCQFMHQMLAKQHQLKIIKKAAKDVQNLYQKHKSHLKDEFYSFEAQAVQLEASRLTLESLYEDVFTSQHRLLARLMEVVADGKAASTSKIPISPLRTPSLQISTQATEPMTAENSSTPIMDPGENDDTVVVLSGHSKLSDALEDDEMKNHEVSLDGQSVQSGDDISVGSFSVGGTRRNQRTSRDTQRIAGQLKAMPVSPPKRPDAVAVTQSSLIHVRQQTSPIPKEMIMPVISSSQKTARERRRQIEHMRLTGEVGNRSGTSSKANVNMYDDDKTSVRLRMRELEGLANQTRKSSSPKSVDSPMSADSSKNAREEASFATKKDGNDSTSKEVTSRSAQLKSESSSDADEGASRSHPDSKSRDTTREEKAQVTRGRVRAFKKDGDDSTSKDVISMSAHSKSDSSSDANEGASRSTRAEKTQVTRGRVRAFKRDGDNSTSKDVTSMSAPSKSDSSSDANEGASRSQPDSESRDTIRAEKPPVMRGRARESASKRDGDDSTRKDSTSVSVQSKSDSSSDANDGASRSQPDSKSRHTTRAEKAQVTRDRARALLVGSGMVDGSSRESEEEDPSTTEGQDSDDIDDDWETPPKQNSVTETIVGSELAEF